MPGNIKISVYFMWEWWERHFHSICQRPDKAGDDELVNIYLLRKRFLFEKFGQFGIGEETPVSEYITHFSRKKSK